MKSLIKKYGLWMSLAAAIGLFILLYAHLFSSNYYPQLSKVKTSFNALENELTTYQKSIESQLQKSKQLDSLTTKEPFFLHIYKNDTLVYWNTNKLPVSKFADLQYPSSGLLRLQNGWYYAQTNTINEYTYAVSFLIKNEYSYQNEYLKNEFSDNLKTNFNASISLDESSGFPIYNQKKQYLFSITVNDYQTINEVDAIILFSLLIIILTLTLFKTTQFTIKTTSKWSWVYPFALLGIRYLSIHFAWLSFLKNSEIYSASLYGTNALFPNFTEYCINILVLLIISYFCYGKLKTKQFNLSTLLVFIVLIIPYIVWICNLFFFQGLIENSSIPLHIEELFKINSYSIIAILSIAVIGFIYFITSKTIIRLLKNQSFPFKKLILFNSIIGIAYFLIEVFYLSKETPYTALLPFVFLLFVTLLEYKEIKQKHLVLGMSMLAIYAFASAIIINDFSQKKGKSERELYASQLMVEKDIITELEFLKLAPSIKSDKLLQQMISVGGQLNFRDFERTMERRHFNKFWERYECKFFLYNEKNESLLNLQGSSNELWLNLNDYVNNHGVQSEISPSIYFISDYIGQYSYIIKQQLHGKNDEIATLFVTLKSKKVPEEIGYPRLLISSESSSLHHLDNYSIAKYHNKRLVSQYGLFNYPNTLKGLYKTNPKHLDNFNYNGYNHLIQHKSKNDVVVLSSINSTWVDVITLFSYLFCFFGILLLPIYIRFYAKSFTKNSISLATKIQVTLITIVVISLTISAVSSGAFIRNQYSSFTELSIKEKVQSIEEELTPLISKEKNLTIQNNASFLNFQLIGLSKVFKTDINIYDEQGFLISTSRQNVFNSGLLSEQINPTAKKELIELDKSEFIHSENIGNLYYNSAYAPIYNKSSKIIGYINLQHFGQQEEVEHQIQQFLMSVISVFVLLLATSAIVAIFVANWITNPLQMLQKYVSNIHLGKTNQYIQYHINDEIGALVKSYNMKIDELEYAAQQLAQSERESAWRDMAKQVAHEIKNPLTPMKLSVQHLMRSFDPDDVNAHDKINKVSSSLIEQIDALTKIANEFSNFAKMQKPEFETVDIVNIINNVIELFKEGNQVNIQINAPEKCFIKGDKDQLLRVFNNLIKNSSQAINEKQNGLISISVKQNENVVTIGVTDNGSGISKSQQAKIFVPYFTTKSNGSGIGLAMVKQIIMNHQGTIDFESEEGVGTTFTIELPLN
ncbi:MAG: HAMP domain-containing histidine kinase [Crocinitomicaceae bacterium]|nr:HAMP domain-containing histidine kinase [Crocinitomicaceae bacterium]